MTNILKPGNTFKFTHSEDPYKCVYTATVQKDGNVFVTWQWGENDDDVDNVDPSTCYQPDSALNCIQSGIWVIIEEMVYEVLSDDNEWVEITEQEFETIKRYTVAQTRALKVVG